MLILAIDTSGDVATCAILENDKILGEVFINDKNTHSIKLIPLISNLFDSIHKEIKSIDYFAASVGPGSFTGLRIGVTTAKTFAFSLNKPVVKVSSLEALVNNLPHVENALYCSMIDARNEQAFYAIYKSLNKKFVEIIGPDIDLIINIINRLNKYSNQVFFCGNASQIYGELIEKNLENVCIASQNISMQRASSVGKVAYNMILNNEIIKSEELNPYYLRKSQAEIVLEIKNKGENSGN